MYISTVKDSPVIGFSRDDVIGAEVVRVLDRTTFWGVGKTPTDRQDINKLGHSFTIKLKDNLKTQGLKTSENTNILLFSAENLGERVARARCHDINDFAEGFTDQLHIVNARYLTAVGSLLIFGGFLIVMMIVVIGSWPELLVFVTDQKFL